MFYPVGYLDMAELLHLPTYFRKGALSMHSTETIDPLNWNTFEPRFTTLLKEELTSQLIPSWLERWSDLEKIIWEIRAGLKRDRSWDETNAVAQKAYQRFIEEVFSPYQMVSQALKTKLLSVTEYVPAPEHMQMLSYLRAEASLFRQENVPLQTDISTKLNTLWLTWEHFKSGRRHKMILYQRGTRTEKRSYLATLVLCPNCIERQAQNCRLSERW
jgi:hypothetical protein